MKKAKTLGTMLRKAREKKGMTQSQLGKAIGIRACASAQVVISRYERGVTFPQGNLGKLIKVLGLPREKVMKLATSYIFSC